jgi:hypothetical protein
VAVRKRILSLLLVLGCATPSAWAAPPRTLHVQGVPEACPNPRTLALELGRLLPQTRFETGSEGATDSVRIDDWGDSFSVNIGEETKRFEDPERECIERARLAAVFVALVLDPLIVPSLETKSEPPPIDQASAVDLELGPLLWVGAASTSTNLPRAGGVGGRLRLGRSVAVSLGVAGFLPAHLEYENAQVEAVWTPVDLSLRLGQRWGAWELSGELGPIAAWLSIAGQGVQAARSTTRVEVGGRLGASVRFWASGSNAVFVSAHGAFFPRPYRLELAGYGEVGRTPTLWLGTTVGAVIDFD